jgi:hypothetical protein
MTRGSATASGIVTAVVIAIVAHVRRAPVAAADAATAPAGIVRSATIDLATAEGVALVTASPRQRSRASELNREMNGLARGHPRIDAEQRGSVLMDPGSSRRIGPTPTVSACFRVHPRMTVPRNLPAPVSSQSS